MTRIAEPARQLDEVEAIRAELVSHGELVIVFGDTIKGDSIRRLVAFGDSLGVPVK
jgi:NADH-quinone oxidoreductase subunit G